MKETIVKIIYPGELSATYVVSADITATTDDILEIVFGDWNAGSRRECPMFCRMKCRSLSVNDIVIVENKAYQCLGSGWKKVSKKYVEDLENKVVNHPRYISGAWFALSSIMDGWESGPMSYLKPNLDIEI